MSSFYTKRDLLSYGVPFKHGECAYVNRDSFYGIHFKHGDSFYADHFKHEDSSYGLYFKHGDSSYPLGVILNIGTVFMGFILIIETVTIFHYSCELGCIYSFTHVFSILSKKLLYQ